MRILPLVRILGPVLAVACSSPPPPSAPSAPLATPAATREVSPPSPPSPTVATTDASDDDVEDPVLPAWKPHRCKRSVWPYYDPTTDHIPKPVVDDEFSEIGGATLDDKARQLAQTRRSDGVCDTRNRDALEAALAKVPPPPAAASVPAWDRKQPLAYRDQVRTKLALTADEERQLERDGFVVPERLGYRDFTTAYYDVHRGELPIYITADSILHAIYMSHDQLVGRLESGKLLPQLDAMLGAMHCGLPVAAKSMPPEVADDVDLYLTVARSLLARDVVPSELGHVDAAAQHVVQLIENAHKLTTIDVFGRVRSFDATQYTPRGHYAGDDNLERYFRTAMWLSRTEFNLVSRDSRSSQPGYDPDPTETPREAVVALALVELAERTGAMPKIAALDQAWSAFAGKREDVPFADLAKLRAKAKIKSLRGAAVAERLRAAIGDGYQRTANIHPMPNVEHLPAIATMIGPRITPDNQALYGLIDQRGPDLQAVELGFMLGHDRALSYVSRTPADVKRLQDSRDRLVRSPHGDDLYSHWLDAIRALAQRPQGALPSFMDTPAFADLRLDSALAAYGQLRHNHVLIQAQVYDQGGCAIPDGYVEPAVDTYRALAAYAHQGRAVFGKLDGKDTVGAAAYFTRLERIMNVLVALSREELANRPLSDAAKRFLAMVVEQRETTASGYMGPYPIATYDGWYIDLFPELDTALKSASFIADFATYNRNGQQGIHYVGAKGPHLGLFVVETGGAPRLMVGPVANAFQHRGPLSTRLTDDDVDKVTGDAPWAKSYTRAAPADPAIGIAFLRPSPPKRVGGRDVRQLKLAPNTVRLELPRAVGEVTIELLDHHFVPMATHRVVGAKGRTEFAAPATPRPIESIRIRVGSWQQRVDLTLDGLLWRTFGDAKLEVDRRDEDE
ncbi:MAG TPA: DUF3160 domain-containing protein [Kofleriaceae bacterium]|nr:DUF3160 domain-containing protein [Kofleriaceae bacterium]